MGLQPLVIFNVAMGSGKSVNDLPMKNLHLSRDFPLPCCFTTNIICLSPTEDWLSTKNWIDWIWPFTTIGIPIPPWFPGIFRLSRPGPTTPTAPTARASVRTSMTPAIVAVDGGLARQGPGKTERTPGRILWTRSFLWKTVFRKNMDSLANWQGCINLGICSGYFVKSLQIRFDRQRGDRSDQSQKMGWLTAYIIKGYQRRFS